MLRNKTILITGASSGLGRAIAIALSGAGNRLIVTARRQTLLEELAAEVQANGSECIAVAADATDAEAAQAVVDAATERFGTIDIAILNAGGANAVVMGTPEASATEMMRIMAMNYATLVNFLCPMIDLMKVQGGTIAWTGSPAGTFGLPKSGPYSAAKAAGRILMDTCRIELAGTPIRFVSLYPGFTYTEGLDDSEVPIKAMIIQKDRAVREMLGAIERGKSHHMFPRRIRWPVRLAAMLPEPVRRWILSRVG
jgi:NADP-dependent 3-hydroxy acid dehydrogenase YdfG